MKNFSRFATTSRQFPNTRARPLVLAIALLFIPPALQAQPTGGQVVSGQASIGLPANGLMTINQTSPKAILNWQSFSIGVGEATHFQQPSGGVALNRITGGSPSQILGSLSSTGQVFLVNPSGVLFGKGAVLSVGGLVASTLDIANADFLAGNYRFFNTGDAKSITNQGDLGAYDGGYIALLAPEVRNEGVISARLGSVTLGAGDRISLDFDGDGLINLNIEASALNGRVENKHAIHADGGQVILSARAAGGLAETVINNSGLIRADSVAERNGRIVLEGAHFVSQTGSLETRGGNSLDGGSIKIDAENVLLAGQADASGHQGGEIDVQASGNLIQVASSVVEAQGFDGVGGRIDLQASHADAGGQVFLSGTVSANGHMGGQVRVLGDRVTLVAADISATGKALGGEILIGGGFQGAATGVPHARRTSVNQATVLDASALDSGAGGRVVVWSDGDTAFAGQALARGGSQSGDGGLIEVSGRQNVFFDGQVNAGPASGFGANGTFLLDPKNITISAAALSSAGYFDLADPSPSAGDRHGFTTVQLDTDRLLVLSPYDSNAASQAGAIYVYDTLTGAMLSMLTGDQAGDQVGSGGFETLYNNSGYDYLVESPAWHGSAGALTWFDGEGSGQSGPSGILGASNSLVGGNAGDQIGSGGIEKIYNNGIYDYVVFSPEWNGGSGAVTFAHGNTAISGAISSENSLVGGHSGDRVGQSLIRLTDYYYDDYSSHFAILSPSWNGGAGAVTFMNRAVGVTGVVSAENSLVGAVNTDAVGSGGVDVIYDNGTYNYLVFSPEWDGGKGAVTFGNGESGVKGVISSSNSFVGDTAGDKVGSGGIITLYYNDGGYDYLLKSPDWHSAAGAVTWFDGSGFGGVDFSGVVSASNSLVGTTPGDAIGSGGFYQLNNGDYVVSSPDWDGGKGAATLIPSASGLSGEVSAANSLVGSSSSDAVSSGGVSSIYINNADNYLVFSPDWNGSFGAVTLGNGVTGEVSASNSFVGDSAGDRVGSAGYTTLSNETGYAYLLESPDWHSSAGAVTWFDGEGFGGVVSAGNSLVGSNTNDQVGSGGISTIYDELNGLYNYVVLSPNWNGTFGAATFGVGNVGVVGTIHSENSLVGSHAGDRIGSSLTGLSSGNYVLRSSTWNGGAGAVTFLHRSSGVFGEVGEANSLVGSNSTDAVGSGGVQSIYDDGTSNYLVLSPNWNGTFGAVTFGNGETGISGAVGSGNSYVGDTAGDRVGSGGITTLSNSSGYAYLIKSPNWHSAAGAVTWFDGGGFVQGQFDGTVAAGNSLVGSNANDQVGSGGITTINDNGTYNYVVLSPNWNGTFGAATFARGDVGVIGAINSQNSLVGSHSGDRIGSTLTTLSSSNYVLRSTTWNGGAGAVTFLNRSSGVSGEVSATNSLVGSVSTDGVGSGGIQNIYDNGTFNYLVLSPNWNSTFGAVTFGNGVTGVSGTVSATNSYVGDMVGDRVGSGGITTLSNSGGYAYLIKSPNWHSSAGAVTWFDGGGFGGDGFDGVVSASNSLVGTNANDQVGSGGITTINNGGIYDFVVLSPNWNGTLGAATFVHGDMGISGSINNLNSLVGSHSDDRIGTTLTLLSSGNYVLRSTTWNGGAGAVTFMNRTSGVTGEVSAANSLVGSASSDAVGSGGVQSIYDNGSYNYLVSSPNWNGTFGAVTFGNGATGVSGTVSASNSFVGDTVGDRVGSGGITTLSNSGGYAYLIESPNWHESAGAVTWFDGGGFGGTGFNGVVSSSNSLVGSNANDRIGGGGESGGIYTFNVSGIYNYLVFSPDWHGTFGAVTFGNGATGVTGVVSSANSLVGSHAGDYVGDYGYRSLGGGSYLIESYNWNGDAGALTFFNGSQAVTGVVSASNSIVGAQAGDIDEWDSEYLSNGRYFLNLASWGQDAGRLLVLSDGSGLGWGFADNPGSDLTISPTQIANMASSGNEVLLQAHNDITLAAGSDITINNPSGAGGALILQAGRSILLNSNIVSDGNIRLYANESSSEVQPANRDSGVAQIAMASGTRIETTDMVKMQMLDGLSDGTAGGITLATVKAANIEFDGDVLLTHAGRLGGNGLVDGDLTVINATLAPGQSPGDIEVTGDLVLGAGSVLEIEVDGPDAFDSLNVDGTAQLGGELILSSSTNYVPPAGSVVFFNSPNPPSGSFARVSGPDTLTQSVSIPGGPPGDPEPPVLPDTNPPALETPGEVMLDQSSLAVLDQLVDTLASQSGDTSVVGSTQQMQVAASGLSARREARLQTFAPAISELRTNPRSADVAECAGSKGESSGACLATRKQKDIDKLIADAPADTRKRVALLIGNDAYAGAIPALTTPISDVEAIAAKLKEKHGFEVILLRNAGKADIIREMNNLAAGTVVADSVMVMYAGHGYQEEGGKGMGYWIPVDAKADSAAGWVSNQDISKLLYAIPARQVLLVSDSCFSGSLTREQRVKAAKGLKREEVLKQRSVLVLSSGGEEPVTDLGHEGHSIFAWNLLKVLDASEKGLTGFELYRQVHEGVVKEFPQQPQYGASIFAGHKGEGDYFLDRLN